MDKIKGLLKKHRLYLLGAAAGSIGGYLYWFYIGCASGTCPITSSPVMTIIWGGLIGGLLFSMFNKKEKEKKKQ